MRLTLRTLLAYLDDVLEPAQAKLMGQKIQESPVARELVSKIREVMRRRRLSAPDVTGPHVGIDPNIVAQYLDNTLAPEDVVEVERVLLESDELLAETAACHQILTMVLAEPTELSVESRERLYALGPVAPGDQLHVETASSSEGRTSESASPENGRTASLDASSQAVGTGNPSISAASGSAKPSTTNPSPSEIPEYLRQGKWSDRVVPAAVIAVIILICVGLLFNDPAWREARSKLVGPPAAIAMKNSSASNSEVTADEVVKPVGSTGNTEAVVDTNSSEPVITSTKPAEAKSKSDAPRLATLPRGLDPAPPPDEPDETTAKTPAASNTAVAKTGSEGVGKTGNAPVKMKPENVAKVGSQNGEGDQQKVTAIDQEAVEVVYTSSEGVVVRYDDLLNQWAFVPHRSLLTPTQLVAVLEPYEASLEIDKGVLKATACGGAVFRMLGPSDLAQTGIDIRRGRVVFQANRKEEKASAAFTLAVGQSAWKVELLSPDTSCAIEIIPREPLGFEKTHDANWYVGAMYVLTGKIRWTPASGDAVEIGDHTTIHVQSNGVAKPTPIAFSVAPEWTDAQKRKLHPLRRYAATFDKDLDIDAAMDESLLSLIKHPNIKISELAVMGLALTESYPMLVKCLAECTHEEGRFAARDGLLLWLPMSPEHGVRLKQELESRYPPAEAEAVYRLLWGFSRDDGKDKITSGQLVEWLRSHRVEIRELADYWIERLIGRKTDFRANVISNAQRESQVRRIEEKLIDGALVKQD